MRILVYTNKISGYFFVHDLDSWTKKCIIGFEIINVVYDRDNKLIKKILKGDSDVKAKELIKCGII